MTQVAHCGRREVVLCKPGIARDYGEEEGQEALYEEHVCDGCGEDERMGWDGMGWWGWELAGDEGGGIGGSGVEANYEGYWRRLLVFLAHQIVVWLREKRERKLTRLEVREDDGGPERQVSAESHVARAGNEQCSNVREDAECSNDGVEALRWGLRNCSGSAATNLCAFHDSSFCTPEHITSIGLVCLNSLTLHPDPELLQISHPVTNICE